MAENTQNTNPTNPKPELNLNRQKDKATELKLKIKKNREKKQEEKRKREEARERLEFRQNSDCRNFIIVYDFPFQYNRMEIDKFFSRFGEVTSISIYWNKRFKSTNNNVRIGYKNPQSCLEAVTKLKSSEMDNKKIKTKVIII